MVKGQKSGGTMAMARQEPARNLIGQLVDWSTGQCNVWPYCRAAEEISDISRKGVFQLL